MRLARDLRLLAPGEGDDASESDSSDIGLCKDNFYEFNIKKKIMTEKNIIFDFRNFAHFKSNSID